MFKINGFRNGTYTALLWAALFMARLAVAQITLVPPPIFIPLPTPEINVTRTDGFKVLIQQSFTFQAGEFHRVVGRVDVASSVNSDVDTIAHVVCFGPDGFESEHGSAEQNHEGKGTSVRPNYPYPGHLALSPSLLFQPPTMGTYQCQLVISIGDDATMTVLAQDVAGDAPATWLQVSAANDAGAGWWQNQPCDAYGNYPCLYLGGASHQTQVYIFQNDGSPQKMWWAAGNAAFVDALAHLQATTCYNGTHSCSAGNTGGSSGTVIDSHLELIQFNSTLGVCKLTSTPEQITTVGNDPHHYAIDYALTAVPVDPSCGSSLFELRIPVTYVSGNPIKIDGSTAGPGETTSTHAYAINSAYGVQPRVPDLVGLTEAIARQAITQAGYVPAGESYALSTAPAGVVTSQNPAAGTLVPSGQGIAVTISAGGAIVPYLLSLAQSSATSAIAALGLVPAVGSQKACINPGEVLNQSPSAGTLVTPGSTVHITVDSGSRKTCVIK